jgi:hypothetical protein
VVLTCCCSACMPCMSSTWCGLIFKSTAPCSWHQWHSVACLIFMVLLHFYGVVTILAHLLRCIAHGRVLALSIRLMHQSISCLLLFSKKSSV